MKIFRLVSLGLVCACSSLGAADLPMFRGNLERTGVFDAHPGRALAGIQWTFSTKGPVRASAVCAGDLVLFGSGDGNLYAVEIETGRQRWRASLGGPVHSTPAVDGKRVFVTSRGGGLTALDLSTGKKIWNLAMGPDLPFAWGWDYWLSSPAVANGIVYAGSGDGNLYAVDAASGRQRWRVKTGGRVRSSPAIADGVVYVGSRDGRLYAVDAKTGETRWTFAIEGFSIDSAKEGYDRTSIDSTPALSSDALFFGTRDGREYAVDRATGKRRWTFGHRVKFVPGSPEVSWVEASPALDREMVLVGSSDGHLFHATRAKTGEEVWHVDMPDRVFSSAAVGNGIVFFGCEDGHLFALDASSGAELWRFRMGGPINASPTLHARLIFCGSDDGKLYALATSDEAMVPSRTRRAVFWSDPGPWKWFNGDVAVRDYLASHGYAVLDAAGLARFLAEEKPSESVVVMASDRFPDAVVTEPFEDCALRRYLSAGGRVVWLGLTPHAVTIDPKTGKPSGLDFPRAERLLGVKQQNPQTDELGSLATSEGLQWGMPDWWIGGLAVDAADVTTVLGRDEQGRASAWVKSFGGPPGSGFVRVWGRKDIPSELSWLTAVAEH